MRATVDRLLYTCLILSGAAALIYEILWARQFGLVMGQTVYALSTVISTFLGGLALGAWVGGRWSKRGAVSLRTYGWLEIAIGVCAMAVPWLVAGLDPVFALAYRAFGSSLALYSLFQFVLCALVLVVPTMLMGATLPIAAAILLGPGGDVTAKIGRLYGCNTLGGVVGAGVAGFVLLPLVGMTATGLVAAGLNVLAGLIAFGFSRVVAVPRQDGRPAKRSMPAIGCDFWDAHPRWLAALYGVSGFAALCLEVGWARLVGLSIGSTTYGFTIILVTFIAGIGLGSLLLPYVGFLRRKPVRGIFLLHAIIAVGGLLSLGYLGGLPLQVFDLARGSQVTARGLVARELLLVFATIILPTLAMGGIFPLLTTLVQRSAVAPGHALGIAYSANTLGNIAGSLVAGFVLVPFFGMRMTIIIAAVLSGLAGIGYLGPQLKLGSRTAFMQAVGLAAAIAFAVVRAPQWEPTMISSAPYLVGRTQGDAAVAEPESVLRHSVGRLIDYREGASTVVTVAEREGELTLSQDGVVESKSGGESLRALGHLPLLLHGSAAKVLVIGLGAGHTLSAVVTHPVESVDCVEISPEVVEVARQYFVRDGLDDARVRVLIGDGRNHLRYTQERYDVIISQPSHPWMSGVSSLFTREFFAEVNARLAPGGVACSWFNAYTDDARRSIVGAFAEAFPATFVVNNWMIGLKDDSKLSAARVAKALAHPGVRADVAKLGWHGPADILGNVVMGVGRMREYASSIPINSDENGYVAFYGLGEGVPEPSTPLYALREDPRAFIDPTLGSPEETAAFLHRLRAVLQAWEEFFSQAG